MPISSTLQKTDSFLLRFVLPIGLFVQITGIFWIGSKGGWVSQSYTWLLLPAFICFLCRIPEKRLWKPSLAELFLIGFLAWAFISSGWSDTTLSREDILKRCIYILLFVYALTRLSENPEKLKKIVVASFTVAVFAAFFSLVYHYIILGKGIGYREYRIYNLIPGSFADLDHPVQAGLYYSAFAVMIFAWQATHKKMTPLKICLTFTALFLIGFYILETWSRGAWVAALTGCTVTALFTCNRRTLLALFITGLICAVLVFTHYTRFYTLILDDTFSGRTHLWKTALEEIARQPWAGHGFRASFTAQNSSGSTLHDPHSYYLQLLRMYGIIGAVLFAGFLAGLARLVLQYRHEPLVIIATGILCMILTGMVADIGHIITRPGFYWLYVWFPTGLILGVHYRKKYLTRKEP